MPTTVLAERVINIADVIFTPNENDREQAIISVDNLNLNVNDIASNYFFVSVDFSEAYQFANLTDVYLVGLFLTIPETVPVNRAYTQFSDGTWFTFDSQDNWGFNGDLWINPLLCSNLDPQECNYINNAQNPSVPYSLVGDDSYVLTSNEVGVADYRTC